MSEHAPFLAAIAAAPGEDAPRLVYADWLEEHDGGDMPCGACRGEGATEEPAGHSHVRIDECSHCRGTGRVPNGYAHLACDQRLAVALRAVLAAPGDDAPRLAYAATCEGYGRAERAELIRAQCKLARMPSSSRAGTRKKRTRRSRLADRVRDLLDRHGDFWACQGLGHGWGAAGRRLVVVAAEDAQLGHVVSASFPYEFRRGFVERLTLGGDDWCRHADALTAAAPVREVTLTSWPSWGTLSSECVRRGRDAHAYMGRLRGDTLAEFWPAITFRVPSDFIEIPPMPSPGRQLLGATRALNEMRDEVIRLLGVPPHVFNPPG